MGETVRAADKPQRASVWMGKGAPLGKQQLHWQGPSSEVQVTPSLCGFRHFTAAWRLGADLEMMEIQAIIRAPIRGRHFLNSWEIWTCLYHYLRSSQGRAVQRAQLAQTCDSGSTSLITLPLGHISHWIFEQQPVGTNWIRILCRNGFIFQCIQIKLVLSLNARIRIKYIYFSKWSSGGFMFF